MSKEFHYESYVIHDGEDTYYKVINFPGHESMWVLLEEGDEYAGIGTIANEPICSSLEHGQRIRYANGTDEIKPEFVGVI
tara:strand:- start:1962 stop:2201 length:240 start_codon:yes stop_codon:yes gene_type:complete